VLPHAGRLVRPLVRVSPEIVTLGLEKVRGEVCAAVAVVEGERRSKTGGWDAVHGPRGDDPPPPVLVLLDLVDEEGVEEEAGEVRVLLESLLDVAQECRADDAAAPTV
jgi:hypothetical protein